MIELYLASLAFTVVVLLSAAWKWLRHYQELVQLRERFALKDQELTKEQDKARALKEELTQTFSLAAQEAMRGSHHELLQMAEMTLGKHQQLAQQSLESKKTEINHLVDPLKKTLELFHQEVSKMESERQRSYALVESEIKKVVENSAELSKETRALKDALKRPHVRGRWGEVQLRNCVELAGMSEFADVSFQDVNVDDDKLLIPDMVVRMPGGRSVVVDAKTPLDGFLSSLEATGDEERASHMLRHGRQVREHVKKLSLKSYGERLKESADFTVLFLPNESFLYAALETQPDLVEYAMEKKILIATPPTFVGLLKVIRFGWNEDRLAKNAEEISLLGQELHKRVADFVETYQEIGKALLVAQDKFDQGTKRLQSRVLVQARRMEVLGAKSHKELPQDL